jgi:hypothetical protein
MFRIGIVTGFEFWAVSDVNAELRFLPWALDRREAIYCII